MKIQRDPNGKLYKRKLRDPYWKQHDSSIVGSRDPHTAAFNQA